MLKQVALIVVALVNVIVYAFVIWWCVWAVRSPDDWVRVVVKWSAQVFRPGVDLSTPVQLKPPLDRLAPRAIRIVHVMVLLALVSVPLGVLYLVFGRK